MAIAELTIVPIGTGTTSLSGYVAEMQRKLATLEGISYELTSMSTIIEGPLDRILDAVKTLHEHTFESGALRVSTSVKIDDRRDKEGSSAQKLASVQARMTEQSEMQ
ncbi:MTH1187 family thiamine-binding protein [Saccharibacillus qingshengii]|uniref:MTH1187 family thiamine-binding protein n=1 Tax=Saccharibacillus qingshengii TaxID=1763540 RepID=UPI0015558006|nr:MTH1187 family thiamine-binding protein [Saccharibacillus qingshengii]